MCWAPKFTSRIIDTRHIMDWKRNVPNPKLRHKQKNGHVSRGTLVIFVWVTIGQKYLNGHISAKNEDIQF